MKNLFFCCFASSWVIHLIVPFRTNCTPTTSEYNVDRFNLGKWK